MTILVVRLLGRAQRKYGRALKSRAVPKALREDQPRGGRCGCSGKNSVSSSEREDWKTGRSMSAALPNEGAAADEK
jgi:hypothetical protein